jgi:transcriptional regulator CtsR
MSNVENHMSIDEAIESGDPELIAQALAIEESKEQVVEVEETKTEEIQVEETKTDPVATDGFDDEKGKAIESKSGGHTIPYSVLEAEREANKQLREQLETSTNQYSQLSQKYESNEQAIANVKTQLEAKGLDTDSMFKNPDEISDADWKDLEEDYGPMGKMMKTLVANQQAMASQIPAAQQSQPVEQQVNPTAVAIEANADLSSWQKTDPDRWTHVVQMDQKLKADPQWQSKSLDERFEQAVKLTKTAFGDNLTTQDRANKIIQERTQAAPDSLTDIGGGPAGNKSDVEALSSMTAEQIEARMESMSSSQIDAMYAEGF